MNIAVCLKLVPDPEDIEVLHDRRISLAHADWIISGFDLQALEAAVQLAEKSSGKVTVISAGPSQINQSRLKKDILSRGPQDLFMVVDDSLANADTSQTASVLAEAVKTSGPYDLVLCGEGSADLYFQQTGMQLGELLGWPVLNFISKIDTAGSGLLVERTLEDEIEVIEVQLPAILSVTTDIQPVRLPTMKEILKAGQKPVKVVNLQELGIPALPSSHVETLETRVPQRVERKQIMLSDTIDEAVQSLIGFLTKEGIL